MEKDYWKEFEAAHKPRTLELSKQFIRGELTEQEFYDEMRKTPKHPPSKIKSHIVYMKKYFIIPSELKYK